MPSRGFIPKEKSVSGFKCPQDTLTLYLEATVASDLKLKSMLIYHSKMAKFLGSLRMICPGRSQDGRGVGRGEHFLPHKFIKSI